MSKEKMVFIKGGNYSWGSLKVTVADFWMDEKPVTVAQYLEAVKAGACTPPDGIDKYEESNWNVAGRENHPVNCVDWYQANAYAKWAGKRLPTREEWAWAARGGDEARVYPWGSEEEVPPYIWWSGHRDCCGKKIPVYGTCCQTANIPGKLHYLAGNVEQWTSSDYFSGRAYIVGSSYMSSSLWKLKTERFDDYKKEARYPWLGFRLAV